MLERRPISRLGNLPHRADEIVVSSNGGDESERRGTGLHIIIWRRRWIVIACVIATLASAWAYLLKAKPVYSSDSVVYVQRSIPKIVSDEASTDSSNSAGYLYTQCMLVQSTAILSASLEKPGVRECRCLAGVDNPVAYLKSQLTAAPGKQGDVFTVSMESPNPGDAVTIVNAVVEAYIDYQSKQHQSTAVQVLGILQKERDAQEADLKRVQDAMFDYRKANPDIALDSDKNNPGMVRLQEFSEALNSAQLRQLDIKTAIAEAESANGDVEVLRQLLQRMQLLATTDSTSDQYEQQKLAQYGEDRLKLEGFRDQFGEGSQEMLRAKLRLQREEADLAAAAQAQADKYKSMLIEAMESSKRRVAELQDAVEVERKKVMNLTVKDAEFDQLSEQRERINRAIDLFDARMKDINVTDDVGALTVSVLEFAKLERFPLRPKRSQTLAMALVAGLMVGIGGAMLRDMIDQRLRSTEEIAALLNLPVLGAIPHMVQKMSASERGQEIKIRPRSDVAEAYRTVRTAIYFGFGGMDTKSTKTILVTSPAPGDGKSTLISNLAIAIAQANRRILLIDADTRRPMQHKIFKLAESPGLSSVLTGKSTFAEAVQQTGIVKLDILQCGPIPHNPAEMLNSQSFLDLLKEVSGIYDQVLIDSPPVMPVTDARILSASCDATLLVLRAERSTRRMAELARDALAGVGGSLIGVVVNDVPRGQAGYGYYYYGYGRYSYSSNSNGNGNGNGHTAPDAGTAIKVSSIVGTIDVPKDVNGLNQQS